MFETRNQEVLLKQNHGKKINLDLRNVILLDSQSTMDLFCNPNLINKIRKSKSMMKLQSNGGRIVVNQKATMSGYHAKAWFSRKAVANIFALSNLIKQYHVTYDSKDQMFVVHREDQNKSNMEFKMHKNGLHYFDPGNMEIVLVNTVMKNKEGFQSNK